MTALATVTLPASGRALRKRVSQCLRAVHKAENKTNAKVDSVSNDMVAGRAYPPAVEKGLRLFGRGHVGDYR